MLEFKPALGFGLPTANPVKIFANQESIVAISYAAGFTSYLINRTNLQLVFSWPTPQSYIIETSATLTNWAAFTNIPANNGAWYFMETNITKGNRFYRARTSP